MGGVQFPLPSPQPAAGARSGQPGTGPFPDEVALELGQRAEDVKDQFAARGGGIDALGQAAQANLALLEGGDDLDEVPQGAAQAVQAPDDQGIAGAHVGQRLREAGPLGGRAALGIGEHTLTAGSLEGILLQGEGLLVGRDAGVANQHALLSQNASRQSRGETLIMRRLCETRGHGGARVTGAGGGVCLTNDPF